MEKGNFSAQVIESGRITIPKWIRGNMDLSKGDQLLVEIKKVEDVLDE